MRVIFGCYIVVAVGLTAVQMLVAYRAASHRLQEDVAALQRTFSPGIEDAMWRYNAEVLRGILAKSPILGIGFVVAAFAITGVPPMA